MRSPFNNQLREVAGGVGEVRVYIERQIEVLEYLRDHLSGTEMLAAELKIDADEYDEIERRMQRFDARLGEGIQTLREACAKLDALSSSTEDTEWFAPWMDREVEKLFTGIDYDVAEVVASVRRTLGEGE